MDYGEFQARVFELYAAGAYDEALEHATAHAGHFPLHANSVTLWKACLATRAGQESLARWFLEEGLAAGEWWAPEILRTDPDLEPLREDAEFRRLVGMCEERRSAAEAESMPLLLLAEPAEPPPHPLLVVLHGQSWNGVAFTNHWRAARDKGWLLAAPQSSQVSGPDRFGWLDLERAEDEVRTHVASLRTSDRVDSSRVIVGGFSAGARLALRIAAAGDHPFGGVIAVAPRFDPADPSLQPLGESLAKLRVALVGGRRDADRSAGLEKLGSIIEAAGGSMRLHVFDDVSHAFPPSFGSLLPELLDFVTA